MGVRDYGAAERVRLAGRGVEVDCFSVGEGRPVVLVHGIGGGAADWELNVGALAERGFRAIAVDMPGHGASDPPPRDWDPRDSAAMVRDFLDALGLGSAALIGHSAGGLLAAAAALQHPERVEALVLNAPAGFERRVGWTLRALTVPVLGEFLMRPSEAAARAAMARIFCDPRLAPRSFIDRWIARAQDGGLRRSFFRLLRSGLGLRGLRRDLVYGGRLGELAVPTLVVWGTEDRIVPAPRGLEGLVTTNARLSVRMLERCGHWPHVERAEAFNALAGDFLAGEGMGRAPSP